MSTPGPQVNTSDERGGSRRPGITNNPPHNFAVDAIAEALRALLLGDEYRVREEKSIQPWEHWWPEPDITIVRGPKRRYAERHPGPGDIVLVAEISEALAQDRTKKSIGYAQAGFPGLLDSRSERATA